jgi:TP901 family phage tail tape measure protein
MKLFEIFGEVVLKGGKEAGDQLDSLDKKGSSAGGVMEKLGGAVTAMGLAFGAAAVGMAAAATTLAVDFQKGMSNIATLLDGDVNSRIEEMGTVIKELQVGTGQDFATLQDGLYQVVSALGDSAESMGILEIAAKGAKAGNAGVSDSVNLLSAVMKGYGNVSEEAAKKASDLAFTTVKLGQTSFPELAASLGKVIPLASTLKVSQEELFGVMATMTGVTGNTAEVSTQLRAALTSLMKPTGNMQEALEKMGYATGAQALEALGLQGTLSALKNEVGGNEVQFSNMFSSVEAGTLALAATGSQADVLAEKTLAMSEAIGATDSAFKAQTNNLQGTIDQLKQFGTVAMLNIGEKFLPVLQRSLDWVIEHMPQIEGFFNKVFDTIGFVVSTVVSIFETFFLPILNQIYDFVVANIPTVQALFETAFNMITEVATTLYDFFNEYILPIFTQLFEWVMGHMPTIQETAQKMFDRIIRVATLMWEFFKENILPILATFYEWVQSNMPLIQSIVESVFKAIFTVAELVWDFFEFVLIPVFQALWDFISPTFPLIQAVVESTFGAILKTVESLASGFETMIGWVKSAVDWIEKFNKTKVEEKDVSSSGGHGGISSGLKEFTGGKRALGGPVNAGQTYMVGERGPELVTFGRSGMVTPNHELGGQGINITINNPVVTDKRMVDEIGKQLVSTLRAKGLVTT